MSAEPTITQIDELIAATVLLARGCQPEGRSPSPDALARHLAAIDRLLDQRLDRMRQ